MKKSKRSAMVIGLATAIALWLAAPASAGIEGNLDTSFGGGDGAVVEDVYGNGEDRGEAMAIQPDGKIVVAGSWALSGGYSNWAVMRFLPDGSVDKSFASGGRTLTDFDHDHDWAKAVAIAPDGKIVVAGDARIGGPVYAKRFAVARYESDGDLDPTFSGDGKAWFNLGGEFEEANDVAVQRDGKIVIAGMRWINYDGADDFVVARVTTNGALDPDFSDDGKAFATFGEGEESAYGVAIQPADGKIVVAGSALDDGDRDFALARFDRNGDLDPAFDGNGTLLTGFGQDERASDVAIAPDGKIVAGGGKEGDFAVARYLSSGKPDTTFDTDGKRSINLGGREYAEAVAVQLDGKIVLAGSSWTNDVRYADMALARFTTTGGLDSTFSGDGKKTQGVSGGDWCGGMGIQRADGKIVLAGTSHMDPGGNDAEFTLLRFHGKPQ